MPSLKEIKGRIGSVQSTLKITSAMKLVASAKLRKAQQTIEGMRPYERKLIHPDAGGGGAQTAHRPRRLRIEFLPVRCVQRECGAPYAGDDPFLR